MYKALYRKWRPLTFDDVISQQHITETLKNQLRNDKTAHAYLFTGSRGTGKTTCARILAKAVNCPNMKNGNPCLECDLCREADESSLTDIIEIDAASNNGVEDIRDLRDAAVYSPERCKFKIYIIDEVHMLSTSAFNALLKIMEEPPPYVKFILATTEIHKVPATVASRCQRYDFRRIKQNDIAERLLYIASHENLELTPDGAFLIAKLADGGMRDAVSLLDQCSVSTEKIDAEVVSQSAGIAGNEFLYELLEAVIEFDTTKALTVTSQLYDNSKDLIRLCEELILQLRNIMLIKVSPDNAGNIIAVMPDDFERLKNIAQKSELDDIMDKLNQFQICRERMTKVMNKRVEFEMVLIKICNNIKNSVQTIDNSEFYDRIKKLENKISSLKTATVSNEKNEVLTASGPAFENEPVPNVHIDIKNVKENELIPCERWNEIMNEFRRINPAVAGSLDGSTAATKGNVMCIFTPNRFFISLFKSSKENAVSLNKAIYTVLGQRYKVTAKCTTTIEETRSMAEQLIKKAINSSIETAVDNNN
ncbi:MAG: DNA polymerase III subunit gamma/tau [Ruminococcus sp.]|nr:DNA polymerase III subunit gamma/tau [Ruminococcus sp.]MDE7104963.1 DNA polymerase III subunit gamma/tau [Ruminococcus sp.]